MIVTLICMIAFMIFTEIIPLLILCSGSLKGLFFSSINPFASSSVIIANDN